MLLFENCRELSFQAKPANMYVQKVANNNKFILKSKSFLTMSSSVRIFIILIQRTYKDILQVCVLQIMESSTSNPKSQIINYIII